MKKYKNIRHIICLILMMSTLVATLSFPATAIMGDTYDFANFTEADSMAFVEDHNIEIPPKLQQSNYLSVFTQELILQSYEAPNVPFCFNYPETQEYAEDIRLAVKTCLTHDAVPMSTVTITYSLLNSKVQDEDGNWVTRGGAYNSKWSNYNCYAFAINRAEQPQYYSSGTQLQYQPGNMGGAGIFTDCSNVNQLADIIYDDLEAMGYSNISLSSSIPTINSSQELICVRMKYDVDYHFMKYDLETNSWYHKPSNSAVLKYNYTPSNTYTWDNEYSLEGVEYFPTIEYDSPIVFITYSKNQINVTQSTSSREYIQPEKDVFCEINFPNTEYYMIHLTSSSNFDFELYDADFDLVLSDENVSSYLGYFQPADEPYYLRINFNPAVTSLNYVDVTFEAHTHSLTLLATYHDHFYHRRTCACGMMELEAHYIRQSDIVDGRYARCLGCGRMLDLNEDMAGVQSLGITQVTANGSYILPSGIVVLADEDVQSYLDGTLQFYHIDNIPTTE